jgi:hypothetical protein
VSLLGRLSDEQVADLLQIGGRTLTRARAASRRRLPRDLSERLFAVASEALAVLEVRVHIGRFVPRAVFVMHEIFIPDDAVSTR